MNVNELHLFLGQGIPPYSNYLCHAPAIEALGTIFNVFSYDAVWDRDSNLSPSQRRADALRAEPRSRVQNSLINKFITLAPMSRDVLAYYFGRKTKLQ